MKTIIKKSATIVSLAFWGREPIENPEPNTPKNRVRHHDISLLIVTSVKELIAFLDRYTDFDKYHNGDYLSKKNYLKLHTRFKIEITKWEDFKQNILCEEQFGLSWDWFKVSYEDTCISIDRLPIGIQKIHANQDLFQH